MDFNLLLPYLVILPVTFISLIVLCLVFVPRLLIPLLVKLVLYSSKFRWKKSISLERHLKASYVERGSINSCKTSILFLHGLSGSGVDFAGILPKFDAAEYHVVGLELLNHGSTSCLDRDVTVKDMVDFMKKFVEQVGLHRRKFHLVAFSMGAGVGTLYTSKYPDDIATLTLAAPAVIVSPTITGMSHHTFKDNKQMLSTLDLLSSCKMKHPHPLIVTALVDHKNHISENMKAVVRGQKTFTYSPELLRKIEVNTLILWGDEDKICLIEGADILLKNIKNVEKRIIKNCGHVMFVTHFDEVASHLLEWLSRQSKEKIVPKSQGLRPDMQ